MPNTNTNQIVLTFSSAEELLLALECVGDEDAPFMIDDGSDSSVTVDGRTFPLWEGYDDAARAARNLMEDQS